MSGLTDVLQVATDRKMNATIASTDLAILNSTESFCSREGRLKNVKGSNKKSVMFSEVKLWSIHAAILPWLVCSWYEVTSCYMTDNWVHAQNTVSLNCTEFFHWPLQASPYLCVNSHQKSFKMWAALVIANAVIGSIGEVPQTWDVKNEAF